MVSSCDNNIQEKKYIEYIEGKYPVYTSQTVIWNYSLYFTVNVLEFYLQGNENSLRFFCGSPLIAFLRAKPSSGNYFFTHI